MKLRTRMIAFLLLLCTLVTMLPITALSAFADGEPEKEDAMEKIEKSPIKEMVITDTIPLPAEKAAKTNKITVLSVADMIAKTIDAIQNHTPVSNVYDLYEN